MDHPDRDRMLEAIKDRMVPLGQAPARVVPGGLETAWAVENTPTAFGAGYGPARCAPEGRPGTHLANREEPVDPGRAVL